jgi:hypothetical protein
MKAWKRNFDVRVLADGDIHKAWERNNDVRRKAWKRNCDFRLLTGSEDGKLGRETVTSVS